MSSATVRVVRAVAFAVVAVLVAAAAHLAGHHPLPRIHVLVIAAALCAGLVAATPVRERGFAAIGAAMVGMQAVLHTSFALAEGAAHRAAETGPLGYLVECARSGSGQHDLAAWLAAHGGTLGTASGSGSVHPSGPLAVLASLVPINGGPTMVAAHLVAALALVGWLRAGEAALWRAMRSAGRRAAVWWAGWLRLLDVPVLDRLRLPAPHLALARARLCSLRHTLSRRGPPIAVAFS